MGLAGSQDPRPPSLLLHAARGAGPAHPLGTNKQETDTNLVLAPSAWPPPSQSPNCSPTGLRQPRFSPGSRISEPRSNNLKCMKKLS